MNTSISIDSGLFNLAAKCAKIEKVDVNQLIESILWNGLDQLQLSMPKNENVFWEEVNLPKSVFIFVVGYALLDYGKSRGVSNEDLESVIAEKRGWR